MFGTSGTVETIIETSVATIVATIVDTPTSMWDREEEAKWARSIFVVVVALLLCYIGWYVYDHCRVRREQDDMFTRPVEDGAFELGAGERL
jgi:amino acid permease